ncbi:hypothetical protein [Flavobacterium sp.]|jgi:hypothetical protein|uniref:hypothetical protein n=1 Tax=Flavobacterium sp. TaxID=239 RepID=UPI0037BEC866
MGDNLLFKIVQSSIFLLFLTSLDMNAQVGIGTTDPTAALDVTSTNDGFLVPRVALTGRTSASPLTSPTTSEMVYNTATVADVVPGFYYWDGTKWVPLLFGDSSSWEMSGNSGTTAGTNFIGTTDAVDFVTKTNNTEKMRVTSAGNIGIGTPSPANKLEITQGTAGNSGLRFTNLNSSSTANTAASKVLGLNSTGDVILTNVPGTQNIVDFSTANPNSGSPVFTPNTPSDESVVYQSAVDNSLWTYNGTSYVTYIPPSTTAWFTAGTTNDAGNSKTSNIYRTGNVGIGPTVPATRLHIQGIQATLGANAGATMLRMSRPTWSGFKWGSTAQFNLGTYDDGVSPVNSKSRLDLVLANVDESLSTTPTMTWLGNGNVGINNTAPSAPLVVQGVSGTGTLKLIAPVVNSSGDNWWMGFGHGTTSNDANDRARIGVDILTGGAGRLFFTTGTSGSQTRAMFIDQTQRVGIGTSSPTSRLEVNGSATNSTAHNNGGANAIAFSLSNLAYTSLSAQSFNLTGMKDGGTYTLAVQGTTSGISSFMGVNPSGTAFVFKSINNGTTIAGKDTLYTFVVMGTTVYVYMATGF